MKGGAKRRETQARVSEGGGFTSEDVVCCTECPLQREDNVGCSGQNRGANEKGGGESEVAEHPRLFNERLSLPPPPPPSPTHTLKI